MKPCLGWRIVALALAVALFGGAAAGHALSPAPGTLIVNTATVQYRDTAGNPMPSLSASVSVPIAGAPFLALEKTASSDPVAAGAAFQYTLRYGNTGNVPATGVTLVDTLPAGVTFQAASAGGTYNPMDRTVTWNLGVLAAGSSGEVTITVTAGANLALGATLVNTALLSSAEGLTQTAVLTTTIGVGTNLSLTKSVTPEAAAPGGVLTYGLSYRNLGNKTAHAVVITDRIPEGTAYVDGSATANPQLAGGILTWSLGDLATGAGSTVYFQVRVSPLAATGTQIRNTAAIVSAEESKTSNTVVTVVSAQSLVVLKMDKPDPVRAGEPLTYNLQVENGGATALTGVVLSDPIPAGTTFVSADSGGVATAGGKQVDWTIGNLAVGEKRAVTLVVKVDPKLTQGTVIDNTASVVANETAKQTVKVLTTVNARTPGVIEFHNAAWQPVIGYANGDTIRMEVRDPDRNVDPTKVETITVVLTNLQTGDTETVTLTETGPDTGIFRGAIPSTLNVTAPGSGDLTVAPNSRIQATYTDPLDASPVSTASALIDPLGVVFDAVTGKPLSGAVVTLRNWDNLANKCDLTSWPALPPGQVNPAAPTGEDGRFAFPLVPPGDYCFQVAPPVGYTFPSQTADADLPSGFTIGNGSRGDKFTLNAGDPPLIRDIPLDPPAGRLTIAKSAGKTTAAIGDIVSYSLKLTNSGPSPVADITVTDVMPHGVMILPGSARLDGAPLDDPRPAGARAFTWRLVRLAPGKSVEITYRAVVGPDAPRGTGVNTASAAGTSLGKAVASNSASVKVKITAGVFTDKGTILGKIFLDRNGNRLQDQGMDKKTGKPIEPGIPGVSLYLEDGTRVVTDRHGKFSLLGIAPGTHVLRVDETTLPEGLTLVPLSNRFLGEASSQFVTMQPGGLVQADFAVRGEWTPPSEKSSPGPKEGADQKPAPAKEPPQTVAEVKAPPPAAVATAGTSPASPATGEIDLSPTTLPSSSEGEMPSAGNVVAPAPQETQGAVTPTPPPMAPTAGASSSTGGPRPTGAVKDWEEEIKSLTPDLDFLSPVDGAALTQERIRVILKAPLGMEPSLSLNGVPVTAKQIGRRIDYAPGRVVIVEYIGIHLNAGETNILQAEIKDAFGISRGTKRIAVTAAGAPERIVIRTDKQETPADGRSYIVVTVEIRDRQGKLVPYEATATVSVSAGEIVEKDVDPVTEDHQIALRKGVGTFTILAPRETGEAVVSVAVEDRRETAKVFFSPHLRSLFLTGMGEVTLGHGRGTGYYRFLKENGWFDDGVYSGGRGAFFLKGRVYDDILLTAAYDSDKKKRDDLFRENDLALDTEDKYPIYGDESKTGYEALSTDKLYLKLEKNRSYLLYGDYRTELNDTTLAAYTRSFTGLKYELNTPRFKLKSFGSHTEQTQVVDALPGKGISGYYYLTKRPVVEGSERVVIEVRDRYRPDRVLERKTKGRGGDYEIDYDLGAILFKEPIPSHDSDYNPVYVIVSYESRVEGEKYYIYGGRGALQAFDWLEVGATGVAEEKAIGNYHLIGADMTVKLPRKTVFKAEYAQTRSIFEETGLFNWRSDSGRSFTLESEPFEKLRLSGYYRSLGDYFQNTSATDVSRGTTKYGFDVAYWLLPTTQLKGRFYDEKDDLNRIDHRFAAAGVQTKIAKTKLEAEISNETSSETYVPLTTSRSPFDISQDTPREVTAAKLALETELRPDLSLNLSHKHNLSGDNYHMTQGGLNYLLDSKNRLYLREEYQVYRDRDETRTLLGGETQVIKNTVAFNEYRLADGADGVRNQSVFGLRNKFSLGRGITGNVSGEYLRTISGSQRANEPDAVAGTLALEYLKREDMKATGRFEHRRELTDRGRDSYLGELGLAYKLHPDYSLLFRERYFNEDSGLGGEHTTTRTMLGLAYRPLTTNRFNALGKVEYKHETNAAATPSYREDAWIFSVEGVWQATPRLQLAGKYAGKIARSDDFSAYTDLVSARFLYDLTDRWDIGAEYRILTSHKVNTRHQGGTAEVGYRIVKNLWVAVGYSFDKFDADLAGDSYQGEGPYLKLRVKFDENSFQIFRSPQSKETTATTPAGR